MLRVRVQGGAGGGGGGGALKKKGTPGVFWCFRWVFVCFLYFFSFIFFNPTSNFGSFNVGFWGKAPIDHFLKNFVCFTQIIFKTL